MAVEQKRLHVGGLFDAVTEDELRQRLSKYGNVSSVEIIVRRDSSGGYFFNVGTNEVKLKQI